MAPGDFDFNRFDIENIDEINLRDIPRFRDNKLGFVKMMQNLKLLPRSKTHSCNKPMNFIRRAKYRDNYCFYCPKCKSEASLRVGTFFEKAKLDLDQIFIIIYCVVYKNDFQEALCREANLGSNHTACDWKNFVRDIYINYFLMNSTMIGGPGVNVQIDESLVCKRKANVGRLLKNQQTWIVGGVDSNGNVFMEQTKFRTTQVLDDIISRHVLPDSNIVTDGWLGYNNVSNINGYDHQKVIHEREFVNSDGYHTNRIEGTWSAFKRMYRKVTNKKEAMLASYIAEFMFHFKFKGKLLSQTFKTISEIYPFR